MQPAGAPQPELISTLNDSQIAANASSLGLEHVACAELNRPRAGMCTLQLCALQTLVRRFDAARLR